MVDTGKELQPTTFTTRMIQFKVMEDHIKYVEMSGDKSAEFSRAINDMECDCPNIAKTKQSATCTSIIVSWITA